MGTPRGRAMGTQRGRADGNARKTQKHVRVDIDYQPSALVFCCILTVCMRVCVCVNKANTKSEGVFRIDSQRF